MLVKILLATALFLSSACHVFAQGMEIDYFGRLRDRVGANDATLDADGFMDGVFMVRMLPGTGSKTITALTLTRDLGGGWDTIPGNGSWMLGAALAMDQPLYNTPSGVSISVADDFTFFIMAGNDSTDAGYFDFGPTFTLTATFSDGSSASASVAPTPAATTPLPVVAIQPQSCQRINEWVQNCGVILAWVASVVSETAGPPNYYIAERRDVPRSQRGQAGFVTASFTEMPILITSDFGERIYCFRVYAANETGNSAPTYEVCGTTPPLVPMGTTQLPPTEPTKLEIK